MNRSAKRLKTILGGIFACFSFGGASCQSVQPNLQLSSTKIVSLLDADVTWPWAQRQSGTRSAEIYLLNIQFSSKVDFVKLAREKSYHISYVAGFCEAVEQTVLSESVFSLPYLRVGAFSLDQESTRSRENLDSFRREDGSYLYDVFVPLAGPEAIRVYGKGLSIGGEDALPLYDYSAMPQDLCIQVRGAAMWFGGTFNANVVRVPRATVERLAKLTSSTR